MGLELLTRSGVGEGENESLGGAVTDCLLQECTPTP